MIVTALLVLILLTNFGLLASNRVYTRIKLCALQGTLLSLLPIFLHTGADAFDVWLLASMNLLVAGIIAPWILAKSVRGAKLETMVPFVGHSASVILGLAVAGYSFFLFGNLDKTAAAHLAFSHSRQLLPYAMCGVFSGLLMIVARKRAVAQVIGYLMLANGVALFGFGLAAEQPFLVEIAILLDILFAAMMMGLGMYHINREFDSFDISKLGFSEDASID